MTGRNRSRLVQGTYQAVLQWPAKGSGTAWFNPAHTATPHPLFDGKCTGLMFSLEPLIELIEWTNPFYDGYVEIKFEWIDSAGVVLGNVLSPIIIDSGDNAGNPTLGVSGFPAAGNRAAGIKQTVTPVSGVEPGSLSGSFGWKKAMLWMTMVTPLDRWIP